MENNLEENKLATKWFLGSLLVAVGFASWLYCMDEKLSNSTREADLGKTLLELRSAQTSLAGNVSDSRLLDHSGISALAADQDSSESALQDSHTSDQEAHH